MAQKKIPLKYYNQLQHIEFDKERVNVMQGRIEELVNKPKMRDKFVLPQWKDYSVKKNALKNPFQTERLNREEVKEAEFYQVPDVAEVDMVGPLIEEAQKKEERNVQKQVQEEEKKEEIKQEPVRQVQTRSQLKVPGVQKPGVFVYEPPKKLMKDISYLEQQRDQLKKQLNARGLLTAKEKRVTQKDLNEVINRLKNLYVEFKKHKAAATREYNRRKEIYEQSIVAKEAIQAAKKPDSTFGKAVDPDGLMAELELLRLQHLKSRK